MYLDKVTSTLTHTISEINPLDIKIHIAVSSAKSCRGLMPVVIDVVHF